VAGSSYSNSNADEDDAQAWIIDDQRFDLVDEGGKKRIRLNFQISQEGQNTHFSAMNYKVTATGDLASVSESPPSPPSPPGPRPTECDKQWVLGDPLGSGSQSAAVSELRATDGDINTRWVSNSTTGSQKPWIKLQRMPFESAPVCRVDIAWADGNAHKYKFNVDISTDDITWTSVLTNQESTGTTTDFEKYTFQPLPAKFVKITINESIPGAPSAVAQISEIKVFGNT
jgi:hypothetical protein